MLGRLSALLIACSLAACGGSTASTSTETASTSGAEESPSEESADETRAQSDVHFSIIAVDDVARRVDAHDARLAVFDANSRETFDEHHVPGATWVHYDSVTADVLPSDHTMSLVFYCANESCSASHTAAEAAVALGFSDVAVMGGGIQGWIAAGKPVEGASPPPS